MDERVPSPKNLLGYSFINKGKRVEGGGQERPPSSSFLSRSHASITSPSSRLGGGVLSQRGQARTVANHSKSLYSGRLSV